MNTVNKIVKEFFEGYAKGSNPLDLDLVDSQYEDTFMFADPNGTRVVEKQKFLAALPQRQGFFKMLGHQSTKILSLEETQLDNQYVMIKTYFLIQFKKASAELVDAKLNSTFILHIKNGLPKIVFQIEHEDLQKAMEERGLLPAK
jgi:hypothetical protein